MFITGKTINLLVQLSKDLVVNPFFIFCIRILYQSWHILSESLYKL